MRYYFILLVAGIIFLSCKQSAVKQSFSSADSLVIHFKDERAGIVTKTVETAESKAIRRIIEFIDAKETKPFDCGFDGKMLFYKKGRKVQEVDFKFKSDTCNHFVFKMDTILMRTQMRNEAADFLDALEKGLPTYY